MYQVYGMMTWREVKFGRDGVIEGLNQEGGRFFYCINMLIISVRII